MTTPSGNYPFLAAAASGSIQGEGAAAASSHDAGTSASGPQQVVESTNVLMTLLAQLGVPLDNVDPQSYASVRSLLEASQSTVGALQYCSVGTTRYHEPVFPKTVQRSVSLPNDLQLHSPSRRDLKRTLRRRLRRRSLSNNVTHQAEVCDVMWGSCTPRADQGTSRVHTNATHSLPSSWKAYCICKHHRHLWHHRHPWHPCSPRPSPCTSINRPLSCHLPP